MDRIMTQCVMTCQGKSRAVILKCARAFPVILSGAARKAAKRRIASLGCRPVQGW
ncbi:MAG: hypothetical protein HYY93_05070 [Planctomycetes bacterium]|nr:hypothetical protein [Planctomycetota bacterium]